MADSRIIVQPDNQRPVFAKVFRVETGPRINAPGPVYTFLGSLELRGSRHYAYRGSESEPRFWFAQQSQALRYLITGTPGDNAHVVVSSRGDVSEQVNAPEVSLRDLNQAALDCAA